MIADGFTKALPRDKWTTFLKQLNLVDIRDIQQTRKPRGIPEEELDALEDSLEERESGAWIDNV
ncbi:hypothetical protein SAMD00023353_1100590 [Rosellinia necatrix]|uniref:Uncharacterized protein n=1 Tax=Rosellinia necatrix TaxID=77044 RepID=A0A1S8A6G7_ROSNE|nr:hypothetical protein SAMD00023353_1100590 [Rosellinia necatrix]